MRICYVLLSATFGMHQYSADLANRMADDGCDVHLVTTIHAPRDRYSPTVTLHTPIRTTTTGFSLEALQVSAIRDSLHTIQSLEPDVVHFTGPHLWNVPLMKKLTKLDIPVIHTIHDLHPHAGAVYGRLLYMWNKRVTITAEHLLVHGQRYYEELLEKGVHPAQTTWAPLTHLFMSFEQEQELRKSPPRCRYEPWGLFLGRLEVYKGLEVLVEAARQLNGSTGQPIDVVIAGQGNLSRLVPKRLPSNVDCRNRFILDQEAFDLFSHCGLVVLPYIEASQSALVASAYFFRKPVIVTDAGALPEYVRHQETGWVVKANDAQALANTLRAALSSPTKLEQMGQAGKSWHGQQRMIEKDTLREMYERVSGICHQSPSP